MKKKFQKILVISSIGALLLFSFTNTTFKTLNPQTIEFEFSPSPRSIDYHTMWSQQWLSQWQNLRQSTKWFNFHQMSYLRVVGIRDWYDTQRDFRTTHNAFYDGKEALEAAEMLRLNNLKAAVTVSSGLGHGPACDTNYSAEVAGARAAEFEYNQTVTLREALRLRGKSFERVYVDGPFLRVFSNMRKNFSCSNFNSFYTNGTWANPPGRVPEGDNGGIRVVHEYLKALKRYFPSAGLYMTINIVNWRQQDGEGVMRPYFGNEDLDLAAVYRHYLQKYYRHGTDGYQLEGFQFDAPWNVVKADRAKFIRRIKSFYTLLVQELGQDAVDKMTFSFIVNTEPDYNFDSNNKRLGFFPYLEKDDRNYTIDQVNRRESILTNNKYFYGNSYLGTVRKNLYPEILKNNQESMFPSVSLPEVFACRRAIDIDVEKSRCLRSAIDSCMKVCLENDEKYFQASRDYSVFLTEILLRDQGLAPMKKVNFAYGSWHTSPRESVVSTEGSIEYGNGSYIGFVIQDSNRRKLQFEKLEN